MSDAVLLEEIDRDGAVQEALQGMGADTTRAGLFRLGLLAGGGILAAGLPLALSDASEVPKSDVKILNYALTLEYLEAAFYAEALAKGKLSGSLLNFAQVVGAHEAAHVAALKSALGSAAIKSPKFDFKGTTGAKKTFLRTSKTLEDVGVSAYQGQADKIKTPAVLASAGSILAVEARHAAWVRDLIAGGKAGLLPAPEAFSTPMSMSDVLAAVKSTGFIKS